MFRFPFAGLRPAGLPPGILSVLGIFLRPGCTEVFVSGAHALKGRGAVASSFAGWSHARFSSDSDLCSKGGDHPMISLRGTVLRLGSMFIPGEARPLSFRPRGGCAWSPDLPVLRPVGHRYRMSAAAPGHRPGRPDIRQLTSPSAQSRPHKIDGRSLSDTVDWTLYDGVAGLLEKSILSAQTVIRTRSGLMKLLYEASFMALRGAFCRTPRADPKKKADLTPKDRSRRLRGRASPGKRIGSGAGPYPQG